MRCHKESALVFVVEFGEEAMAREQGVEVIGLERCDGVIETDLVEGHSFDETALTVVVQDTVTSSGTGIAQTAEDHGDGSNLCAPGSPNNLTCYLATGWKTAEEIADDELLN
jgi:hypothetical protein